MSKFDEAENLLEDPEVGKLKFVMKTWKSSTSMPEFIELEQRPCTDEDFDTDSRGSRRSRYGFYPMGEDTKGNIESVKGSLKCIDEPYLIQGHFNSQTASNLMIVYEICDPKKQDKCKSDEVI